MPETMPAAERAVHDLKTDAWRRALEGIVREAAAELGMRNSKGSAEIAEMIEMIWPELQEHFARRPKPPRRSRLAN